MNSERRHLFVAVTIALLLFGMLNEVQAASLFQDALEASRSGDPDKAAQLFRESAAQQPAAGTLLNLGITEWRQGHAGAAVLAWEQALWIDPGNKNVRESLEFARQTAQIESPELAWYEAVSIRLPARVWAWLSALSLWVVAGMITLPQVLRWRKAAWHHGLAAVALGIFLLTIPAHFGITSRSQMGFVLEKETALRLTPTQDAESLASLTAGDPARQIREQGEFVFVKTSRGTGWLKRDKFALVCPLER